MSWILVALAALVGWMWYMRRRATAQRRRDPKPLPEAARIEMARTVPVYARLEPRLRERVDAKVGRFLSEKLFTGCRGVVVSDSLRWTIAGHACLMLAGRDDEWIYDDLDEIVIHPLAWRRDQSIALGDGLVIREPGAFDGESWQRGPVILSRAAVRRGLHELDGDNVVFHEFAHQLDAENGAMEGCPVLPPSLVTAWAQGMDAAFRRLVAEDQAGRETFLDPYGAEHPCEFFAVVVESFLERPEALAVADPELYPLLVRAFGFDPQTGKGVS